MAQITGRSAIVALALLLAAPAVAAETASERAACTPDVWRLCAAEIPDVGAIKSCLRREKPRLSAGCRTVMERADASLRTASAAGGTATSRN